MHALTSRRDKTSAGSGGVRQMIAAARREFFVHGFRRVSMDDLAADLRMSKKTLYASFPSKSSLVEAVLKAKFDEVEADLGRLASEDSSDMEEAIHRFLQRVQRHTSEIHPPFVRDLGRETPELFRIVEHRRRRLIRRHVGALFTKGRKAGLIRRDIPVHLLIEILLGAVEAIITPAKVTELGLTLETGYSTVIRVILEGAIERRSRP
jgi:AcrR family transcriptional regulator